MDQQLDGASRPRVCWLYEDHDTWSHAVEWPERQEVGQQQGRYLEEAWQQMDQLRVVILI